MTGRYLYLLAFAALALISACKKTDEVPVNYKPFIAFESVSSATVQEYKDAIVVTISYRDLDGDLGENDPVINNVFVKDERNGVEYKFRAKQLAPDNATVAIQGKLDIELPPTGITDGSNSQSVTYTVYVKDRAGNASNEVTTSAIQISK